MSRLCLRIAAAAAAAAILSLLVEVCNGDLEYVESSVRRSSDERVLIVERLGVRHELLDVGHVIPVAVLVALNLIPQQDNFPQGSTYIQGPFDAANGFSIVVEAEVIGNQHMTGKLLKDQCLVLSRFLERRYGAMYSQYVKNVTEDRVTMLSQKLKNRIQQAILARGQARQVQHGPQTAPINQPSQPMTVAQPSHFSLQQRSQVPAESRDGRLPNVSIPYFPYDAVYVQENGVRLRYFLVLGKRELL